VTHSIYSRRKFIRHNAIAELGLAFMPAVHEDKGHEDNTIDFITPIDGDMLHELDGVTDKGWLKVPVRISADPGSRIFVNGIRAELKDGLFTAEVPLKDYRNIIEAWDKSNDLKSSVEVYRLKNFAHKYRLSHDDNIWFLRDISQNASVYRSIFENPYLGFLKHFHDIYGTKVHLNIYSETDGFNLSRMTDKFRNEWRENCSWLRLSFHAYANEPDNPYINAGYDKVKHDCVMVMDQIRRFAGEELIGSETTLHWGIGLLIHEQYFYPFYRAYQPDYKEKVLKAVGWAADNGYEPAFPGDCVF
jgi:hypothetical protein